MPLKRSLIIPPRRALGVSSRSSKLICCVALESNVSNANSRIYAKERELDRVADSTRSKEAQLISDETTTEDRVLLLADLKDLSERTGELETEIEMLIADRARFEMELAEYEATVASYGF